MRLIRIAFARCYSLPHVTNLPLGVATRAGSNSESSLRPLEEERDGFGGDAVDGLRVADDGVHRGGERTPVREEIRASVRTLLAHSQTGFHLKLSNFHRRFSHRHGGHEAQDVADAHARGFGVGPGHNLHRGGGAVAEVLEDDAERAGNLERHRGRARGKSERLTTDGAAEIQTVRLLEGAVRAGLLPDAVAHPGVGR